VWNGASWKNYGPLEGPLGERVFDIAVCPTDGDVWIASDAGLARYSDLGDKWSYFSRANGMSADQVSGIAFDKDGNIYCATQADGVTMARAASKYTKWTNVRASAPMPRSASGAGLPSNIVNDVLVAHGTSDGKGAGVVYAATDNGLAWSADQGATWRFVRGADWRANLAGLAKRVPAVEVSVAEDELLVQDLSTCLAEDRSGLVWVGHLRKGCEARDPRTMRTTYASSDTPLVEGDDDFVRAMVDAPGTGLLIGRYGNPTNSGVSAFGQDDPSPAQIAALAQGSTGPTPRFPSPAAPPGAAQLRAMTARLKALSTRLKPGEGAFLGDDWATQGDWVGRYGRGQATLAAMDGGNREQFTRLSRGTDHVLVNTPGYAVSARNGPHDKMGIEPWVTWANPQTRNALYDPLVGHRRHAEWTDVSNFLNLYPWAWEGPDVWVTVKVPAGVHRVSLYCYNKDGQNGANRFRDQPIELHRVPSGPPRPDAVLVRLQQQRAALQKRRLTALKTLAPASQQVRVLNRQIAALGYQLSRYAASADLVRVNETPILARARVTDFWDGVYKQFALCGPATFAFKVARDHSFGVLVSGVFFDPMTDPLKPAPAPRALSWMNGVLYDAPVIEEPLPVRGPVDPKADAAATAQKVQTLAAARALWAQLDVAAGEKGGQVVQRSMRLQALRAAIAAGASPSLIANWRWQLQLWNDAEGAQWREMMARAFLYSK